MLKLFVIPAHDRRLIPEGRLSGPMPWVIAIMVFLTVLAAAAGLAFAYAASNVTEDLSTRATVQVVEADAQIRDRQAKAVAQRLREQPSVEQLRVLPPAEIDALMEPWLGTGDLDADIPLPALIDVKLSEPAEGARLDALKTSIRTIAPNVRVEASNSYITPVISLVRSLQWIAFGLVLLLTLATAAAVIISSRSALNTHSETISVVHLLGGTDQQISRLFQRRIALDALLGGLIGLVGGGVIIWLISMQLSALGSGLFQTLSLDWISWVIIASIPLLAMLLAMWTARMTVISALKKTL